MEWLNDSHENVFDALISVSSPLMKEGTHRLVEDFGSEHRAFFDVLGAISMGHTTRARIETYLDTGVGPVLEKLEADFDIIRKMRPITSKETSRDVRYEVLDPFLKFWFRFIYANRSAVEIENYEFVKEIVKRDFNVYSGKFLEKYFIEKLKLINDYSNIGTYWEKANQNEIDIVAINDLDKKALIAEVKINPKKIDLEILKQKAKKLEKELNTYECEYLGFSLNDM